MKTALITGASGGIGYELAKIFATKGISLVLVARSEDKLLQLKQEILQINAAVQVHVFPSDLSVPDASIDVYNYVRANDLQISFLVNNAGFGLFGYFYETEWQKESEMVQLNITALTQLTKLLLPDMIHQREGKIMNVASVAAFVPGPLMSVYYATKAYVLSFSEAIANELADKNITVTALCPGPTQTGFESAAKLEHSKLFRGKKLPTAAKVASYGFKAMMNGETVAVHGFQNKAMMFSLRFAPRSMVRKMVRWMSEKA